MVCTYIYTCTYVFPVDLAEVIDGAVTYTCMYIRMQVCTCYVRLGYIRIWGLRDWILYRKRKVKPEVVHSKDDIPVLPP